MLVIFVTGRHDDWLRWDRGRDDT